MSEPGRGPIPFHPDTTIREPDRPAGPERSTASIDDSAVEYARMTRQEDDREGFESEHGDRATANSSSPLLGVRQGAPSHRTTYTWTCPYCETSRSKVVSERGPAEHALKLHVLNTEGDGHEQRNSYPSTLDPDALEEFVRRSDG